MIVLSVFGTRPEALESTWAARTDEILRSLESAPRSDVLPFPTGMKKAISE